MIARLPERRFACRLAAIVVVALALRIAIRLVMGTQNYWIDGYGHHASIAQSICAGTGYAFPGEPPTAFRVPLYTFLVAATTCGAGSPWPLILTQALASAGTVLFAGLIARRLAGNAAGLLAAAIYALWPYGAWHDLSLQESGLHAFLAALVTWQLIDLRDKGGAVRALGSGLVLGLLLLTRATMLPFVLCALVIVALPHSGPNRGPNPGRARLVSAVIAAAAMLAVLSPWLAYSHKVTGAYGLGTEGGAALFVGNHPLTFSAFPVGTIDESRVNILASLNAEENAELAKLQGDEVATSDWYRAHAIRNIAADPVAFVFGGFRKLWAAFGPLPTPRHGLRGSIAYAAGWVLFFALALAGTWQRRHVWRDDLLLHAHMLTFCAITALFWAQTSHRSYLDPYLAVFAAVALLALMPLRLEKTLDS